MKELAIFNTQILLKNKKIFIEKGSRYIFCSVSLHKKHSN